MIPGYDHKLVRTPDDWEAVRPRFEAASLLGFDFETNDLTAREVWGLCLAAPPAGGISGLACYIATEKNADRRLNCPLDFHKHLKPWLEDRFRLDEISWVGHNLKFDTIVLRKHGFRNLPQNIYDTMIADWMLHNEERKRGLDVVAKRACRMSLTKDLMEIREYRESDPDTYWQDMLRYGVYDSVAPLKIRAAQIPKLALTGVARAAKHLEMPLVHVTAEMELAGFVLDHAHMESLESGLAAKAEALEAEIHALAGREFKVTSPAQLSDVLFDDPKGLRLTPIGPRGKPRGTKNPKPGAYSTKDEILQALDHPLCTKLIEHRGVKKLLGTYVLPMQRISRESPDGRVRTSWNQTGTRTGRYSSSDPLNMQNTPRDPGLIRKGLVAPPGFMFVAVDYSQIELRLMAHQSGCPVLCRLYHEGADVHAQTASDALKIPVVEVTKLHRQLAKAINFGFLYGMSATRFVAYAKNSYGVRVTLSEAEAFRKQFFRTYPGIVRYHEMMREHIAEFGWAENIVGERRYLPGYDSADGYERWQAWTQGVNYTIQGSAGALIKKAMLDIYRELRRPFGYQVHPTYRRVVTLWGSDDNLAHEAQIVGQVHDELQCYARREIAEPFAKWVVHKMETAMTGFRVPIVAEAGIGLSMEDAK